MSVVTLIFSQSSFPFTFPSNVKGLCRYSHQLSIIVSAKLIILVFYYCVTNYYKLNCFKHYSFIILHLYRSEVHLSLVFSFLGLHEAKIKMSVRLDLYLGLRKKIPLQVHLDCWQNVVPYNWKRGNTISLLAEGWASVFKSLFSPCIYLQASKCSFVFPVSPCTLCYQLKKTLCF